MKKITFFLAFFLLSIVSMAQQKVSGTVTSSEDGLPLPGVTVLEVGSTNGVMTDDKGKYTITVNEKASLQFSSIGFIDKTIAVENQSTLDVLLVIETTGLDEVIVVGYGTVKKKLVTGANLNVSGEKIAEQNTGNAMQALQGIAPGVSITRDNGAPGSGTRVVIRGLGTIGNANPLYIVDGVSTGGIDYLSPSDIESIDVLKDAASCAIYGSRGANGVVLVTTKRAKESETSTMKISYDGYFGVQNTYKQLPVLNAQEYMLIRDEGLLNDQEDPLDWETLIKDNLWLQTEYPEKADAYGEYVWNLLQNGWEGTNWLDEITQSNAPVQNHSLNITGASKNVIYSMGVSYLEQSSILGGQINDAGYKRLTARFNSEMVLAKAGNRTLLKVGENFTYTNTENRQIRNGNMYWNDLRSALTTHPLLPVYWDESPDIHAYAPSLEGISDGANNPVASMFYGQNYSEGKGNNINGNIYAELEPIKNLKIRSVYGIRTWFGDSRSWTPVFGLAGKFKNTEDGVSQNMYKGATYSWTNTLNYTHTFGEHKIGVLLGHEWSEVPINNVSIGGSRSQTIYGDWEHAYLQNASAAENVQDLNNWGADWGAQGGGLVSYFGKVSYNFKERYMFDAILRADGSSNFAKGNRWGIFPSFSAGWNFSEESFMDFDFLSFGKLRASWGQNGNQSVSEFVYSANIAYVNPGYYFGDTKPNSSNTAVPVNVPNPDVTWETSEQLNFGIDAQFLNSRLSTTIDWYKKTTKDWLVVAPIPGTAGAKYAPYINGGDVENTGIELSLGWRDEIGDFKYNVRVSGANNKNKVTKIANEEGLILGAENALFHATPAITRVQVGQPIGIFWGYETDGLLQNQAEVDAWIIPDFDNDGNANANAGKVYFFDDAESGAARPGDVKFVDQNNDGVIDEDDRVKLGNPNPDFELGIQLDVEWKGIYAATTLTGKFGMQVMQAYRNYSAGFKENYTTQIFGRWHGEGTSNTIPRLSSSSHRNTNLVSDIYLHDADYLRVSNLTIGYKFDNLVSNYDWIEGGKVYVSFNNLHTFTSYDGMDPEIRYGTSGWDSGLDLGLFPLARTVMFGVGLTF